MTSQEQQMLQDLFQRLGQTRGAPRDAQAEAAIREGLGAVPEASYWLVQRTLLLEQALQQAQQQIAQLQQQAAQAGARGDGGSFLSGGLGTEFGRTPADQYPEYRQAPPAHQASPAAAPSSWRERWFGAAPRAAAPTAPAYAASGVGSFLGTAAASAAGVAGGMFLFNGLENLLGGHHGNASGLLGGAAQPELREENITQNFFGDGGAGREQLARDAGIDDIDAGDSGFADGGGFFDDDSLG